MDAEIREYIRQLNAGLSSGTATEHTHRPALKTFIEAAFDREAIGENVESCSLP